MVIPNSNLPPNSQPWANKLPQVISNTDTIISGSQSTHRANYIAQSAALDLLSRQIQDLSAQVTLLPIVAQIPLNEQFLPGFTGTGTANYFTLYTSTLSVPPGKTVADVFVFGSVVLLSLASGNTYLARVGINGSYDLSSSFTTSHMAGVSCARTGVSGPTFTITVQASASAGATLTDTHVYLNVMVVYK